MTPSISEIGLAISSSFALSIIAKVSLALLAALTFAALSWRSRASLRHLALAIAFGASLLLPVATALMPQRIVEMPIGVTADLQASFTGPQPMGPSEHDSAVVDSGAPDALRMSVALADVLRLGWFMGFVVFLAPAIVGLLQARDVRRRALPWPEGQTRIEEVLGELRGIRRIDVLRDEAIPGPWTCGLFRPAILFPIGASGWTKDSLTSALIHEIEHVRRADWFTFCVSRFVCAMYWFHPLVWIAWRRLGLEAERACDDAALAHSQAPEYASLLVAVAEYQRPFRGQHVLGMANRGDLSARVEAIMNQGQARGAAGRTLTAAAVGLAAALVVALAPVTVVVRARAAGAGQAPQRGVHVELVLTSYALPMPDADNQDSVVVAVTDDGSVYFGGDPIAPGALAARVRGSLSSRSEKKLYIKADARTPYADVATVLAAVRTAGVEAPTLLTGQREPEPGSRVSLKRLEVSVGPSLPSGVESTVVQVLNSGQQNPTIAINNEQIPWATLQSMLRQLFQNRSEKVVLVKADGRSPFAHVVQVIDMCRAAGAQVVLVLAGV